MKKALRSRKPVVSFVSLGCPKNLVDTEVMAGAVLTAGYDLSFDSEDADILIINTCAFIPPAREETDAAIRAGMKWKRRRPGRKLVVAGCLLQWDKERDFLRQYRGVDLWSGVDGAPRVAEYLQAAAPAPEIPVRNVNPEPCYLYDEHTPRLQMTAPHLAYLKIADGCDNRCSYCSIPNIRGALRSRTVASVVQEARNLVNNGVKELLLIAQDITAFGHDRPGEGATLAALLRELEQIEGDFWIRLLYTHPAHYTDELIATVAASSKVLPYLDIPLQHINDTILKRMGRKVTRAGVETLLATLRERIPGVIVRTTFITGFPGEGEAEYRELMEFVQAQHFDRLGVFAYSAEPNTPAAAFAGQVPERVAEERAAAVMAEQRKLAQAANAALVGRVLTVLVDGWDRNRGTGRGVGDAPDIDNQVHLTGPRDIEPGSFRRARVTRVKDFELFAEIEEE